jgi:hypothetical protein
MIAICSDILLVDFFILHIFRYNGPLQHSPLEDETCDERSVFSAKKLEVEYHLRLAGPARLGDVCWASGWLLVAGGR